VSISPFCLGEMGPESTISTQMSFFRQKFSIFIKNVDEVALTPKGHCCLEGQNGFWAGSYDLNFS